MASPDNEQSALEAEDLNPQTELSRSEEDTTLFVTSKEASSLISTGRLTSYTPLDLLNLQNNTFDLQKLQAPGKYTPDYIWDIIDKQTNNLRHQKDPIDFK